MVAVEALPDEPSGGGEAMVSIACGVLEGCDRLSCKRGAVVHLYPSHPTRAIPHPNELEHPLSRLPILTEHLEEVAPAQTSSVQGSMALTVALRGSSVSRAASPKREPGSRVASLCSPSAPPASTSTRPLRRT